jgi:hypothetical protein
MICSTRRLRLAAPFLFFMALLAADPRPNFTGVWKADLSKSTFGPMSAPSRFERRVMHLDPDLQITTTQVTDRGEMKNEVKHFTDGRESSNTVRGAQVKSTLTWEGKVLRIDSNVVAGRQGSRGDLAHFGTERRSRPEARFRQAVTSRGLRR